MWRGAEIGGQEMSMEAVWMSDASIFDRIGTGAVIKRLEDGRKAVVVDYTSDGRFVVATYTDKADKRAEEKGICPRNPGDYEFLVVRNTDKWIVLSMGSDDHVLMD